MPQPQTSRFNGQRGDSENPHLKQLGFIIKPLNLVATADCGGVFIYYADGTDMPKDQQIALLQRVKDALLSSLVTPLP